MNVPVIFDRKAVRLHRDRASRTQHATAPILEAAADILLDRLDDVMRSFSCALDIGGRGIICQGLERRKIPTIACDLSEAQARCASAPSICADEEHLPFAPGSFDLVIANLSLHWVNDLPGLFHQIRSILRPDGLFLASIPILPTLRPLRQALEMAELAVSDGVSPRVSPLPTQQSCVSLLQRAGFALPVVDTETLELRYRSLRALMADLRAAGESNALALRPRTIPPRLMFAAAAHELEDKKAESFCMPLHMAILAAWSPSGNQPQPLTPGQFTHSLHEVLQKQPQPLTKD